MRACLKQKKAFVLVMSLWTLTFLTVLAVALSLGVRQKIMLLGRLEDRAKAHHAVEAGVKKAFAILVDDFENNQFSYSVEAKSRRHNNEKEFKNIKVGDQQAEVFCAVYDEEIGMMRKRWGLCDEQAKININFVKLEVLQRLLEEVVTSQHDQAKALATAIIDWRDYGQRELTGFFSDDYYAMLDFPYDMKENPYERMDELLLVKGVSKEIYQKLRSFITIWGDGRVNINTASGFVLRALGLDQEVSKKILDARCGRDGFEATPDDHIFFRSFDVAAEVNALVGLSDKQIRQVDLMNAQGVLGTDSMFYSAISGVLDKGENYKKEVEVAFNILNNKFEYWYEK